MTETIKDAGRAMLEDATDTAQSACNGLLAILSKKELDAIKFVADTPNGCVVHEYDVSHVIVAIAKIIIRHHDFLTSSDHDVEKYYKDGN